MIRNIVTDKIRFQSLGEVVIDSCKANLIKSEYLSTMKGFLLTNSQAKELSIDLDQIERRWQIENCDIEVKNLTGSKKHNVSLSKNEAKIINWIPKNQDAELTVTLKGDTAKIVFP